MSRATWNCRECKTQLQTEFTGAGLGTVAGVTVERWVTCWACQDRCRIAIHTQVIVKRSKSRPVESDYQVEGQEPLPLGNLETIIEEARK